jgi:hypothetical protein
MAIVPAGKLRKMVAQNMDNTLRDPASSIDEIGTENIPDISPEMDISPEISVDSEIDVKEEGINDNPEIKPQKKTLSDYIFKKLEEFGYPGRRLEEFKKKFVNESISPDGTKNITIEIPDKKYPDQTTGQVDTIEAEDLSGIVGDIEKIFGLHFNGAKRSDGKWTINLTSAQSEDPEEDKSMTRDNLDEVYGAPSKSDVKKTEPVRAFTIKEMIKSSKSDMIKLIKKVIGDNNAS